MANGSCANSPSVFSGAWHSVQVSWRSRAGLKACVAGSVSTWHASHPFTRIGPCRFGRFLIPGWHSAVTHPSRGVSVVGGWAVEPVLSSVGFRTCDIAGAPRLAAPSNAARTTHDVRAFTCDLP